MKPISTMITPLPGPSRVSGAEHVVDDDAQQRRDAEKARLRRIQKGARQHAEAEKRLADAMARASARNTQRVEDETLRPKEAAYELAVRQDKTEGDSSEIVTHGANESAEAEADSSAIVTRTANESAGAMTDPVGLVLQRLARGQTRGLLQDCAPMIETIAERLAKNTLSDSDSASGYSEEFACALEFLQGYADAASARVTGADKIAKLLREVRLQFDALAPSAADTAARVSAQSLALPTRSSGSTSGLTRKQEPGHVYRKTRIGRDDETEDAEGSSLAAGGIAAASIAMESSGKVAMVPESSLDKDQRKRREDTLPLVTLRSI